MRSPCLSKTRVRSTHIMVWAKGGGVHTLLHDSVRTAFTAEQRSKPQMCDTAQSHCEPEEPSTLILFRRGQLVGCAKWLERLEHVGALRLGNTGLRKE